MGSAWLSKFMLILCALIDRRHCFVNQYEILEQPRDINGFEVCSSIDHTFSAHPF